METETTNIWIDCGHVDETIGLLGVTMLSDNTKTSNTMDPRAIVKANCMKVNFSVHALHPPFYCYCKSNNNNSKDAICKTFYETRWGCNCNANHGRTEVRWFLIPGESHRVEQRNVVPVSSTELNRAMRELFCRPARGFGQNWFELKIRKNRSPTGHKHASRNSVKNTEHPNTNIKRNRNIFLEYVTPSSAKKMNFRRQNYPASAKNISSLRRDSKNRPLRRQLKSRTPIADRECNNSNDTNLHLSASCRSQKNQSIAGTIIRVEGDGRCLFRSLVTCLSVDLQKARRDDFGSPLLKGDANYETMMADALRAQVVKLMMDNAHFYGQLERTVLNADQPMPPGYCHFRDRLMDMTLTSTMPGDLELNATSTALERQVLVLDVNLKPIVVYGKERFPQSEIVTVRYTRLGPDVGHYDAVIPDIDSLNVLKFGPDHSGGRNGHGANDNIQPGIIDRFNDLISTISKMKLNENKESSINNVGHKGIQVPSMHQIGDVNQSKMDCSPNPTFVPENTRTRNNDFRNDNDNNKTRDILLHNQRSISPGLDSESSDKTKNREACIQSKCNDVLLDILSETVLFVLNKREGVKARTSHRMKNSLMRIPVSSRRGRAAGGHAKYRGDSLHFDSAKWEAMQRSFKTNRMSRKKDTRMKKVHRRAKVNSSTRRQAYFRKVNNMKQNLRKIKRNRQVKFDSRSPIKLSTEKIYIKEYENSNDKAEGNDKVFSNQDEIINTDSQCQKSIGGLIPPLGPIGAGRGHYDGKICFICQMPAPDSRLVKLECALCGRVAHKKCVASNRKGQVGDYFVCSYCVRE